MANFTGTANNDIFQGTVDDDVIQGLAGNDSIRGNGGDDTINAGLGYDTVVGGQSRILWQGFYDEDNLLIVDYSSNTYTGSYSGITSESPSFNLSQGYFSAYYNSNYDADVVNFSNIKRFQITGTGANDDIVTGSGNDTIASGNGDDTITSGYGIDVIDAGAGTDTLIDGNFEAATTALFFSDTISYSSPIVLTDGTSVSNVEKFTNVTTGSGNDTITYSQRNDNYFITGGGDDTINAGLGTDVVNGSIGLNREADNDLLILDYSSNTYTGVNSGIGCSFNSDGAGEFRGVFYAYYNSNGADQVSFSNINRFQITGTGANDNITTGDGNDTIVGGAGNDTIVGSADNDTIVGGADNDTIVGGAGNDTIVGSAGNDTMTGDYGNDTYVVDSVNDVIDETSTDATEIDTIQSSVTYNVNSYTNIENLTLTGTAAINGTGNSLNNTIVGNSAANGISGGAGDDTMTGGAGNDTYLVGSAGDVVNETSALTTEIDTVQSGVSYLLATNVERLTLIGTGAINGTGNSLNNTVTGNSANNTLFGGIGSDTITGGIGNDILIGASGNDSLTAGDGNDRFIYNTNAAFNSSEIGIDLITDFVSGTDKIVLDKTTFTALTSIAGNGFNLASEFAVVGSDAAASTASALIVYSSETDNLFYNQNGAISGLGSGAQLATLSGIITLSPNDFELQA